MHTVLVRFILPFQLVKGMSATTKATAQKASGYGAYYAAQEGSEEATQCFYEACCAFCDAYESEQQQQ